MKILSHIQCLKGMVEVEQVPIRIVVISSRTPVFIYNKYQSFDENIVRILMEYGLDRSEALKNYNHYTLIGNFMDKYYIDARDNPYIIEICEFSNYKQINLQVKKYSDDEIRQRESRESILQH